jgi:hypothetical protein
MEDNRETVFKEIEAVDPARLDFNEPLPKEPDVFEVYQHSKGGVYMVCNDKSVDTETGIICIVYQSLNDWIIWHRPIELFMDGRFQLIGVVHEHDRSYECFIK